MEAAGTPGTARASGDLAVHWRPMTIRLEIGALTLRPVRESDLAHLASMLPDDAEHDPASEMFAGLTLGDNRRRILLQTYWKRLGTWSVDSWSMLFQVSAGDRVVGVQGLEGEHFASLRTVDSWSWLDPAARGRGLGVAMRTAVLALAFDHLGAQAAVSSAREDNVASLAVSRRIGYDGNGVSRSLSRSGPCTLRHMLLTKHTWAASGLGASVTVRGLEGCAPWFGVDVRS